MNPLIGPVALALAASFWLPGWPVTLQSPSDLPRPAVNGSTPALPPIPAALSPPLAKLPPGMILPPPAHTNALPLAGTKRPREVAPICDPSMDEVQPSVVRNGKAIPEGAAFPASHATPPKLWQNGRCAGERMR